MVAFSTETHGIGPMKQEVSVNEKTIHTGRTVRKSGLAEKQHSSNVCAGTDGMSGSVTENIYMGKSLPLTVTTGKGHFMNVKKIQAKKESVVLKKKQMHCVRCRIWLNKGKLVYGKPKLYYYSTVPSVAVVDRCGCVTAKKKGSSVIFVMAPNGVYDKVSVEVK